MDITKSVLNKVKGRCGRLKDIGHDKQAQSLVEMALVMPVFCLLLYGLFAFAMVFSGWACATYTARVAARYVCMHSASSVLPCTVGAGGGCSQELALIYPLIWGAAPNGLTVSTNLGSGSPGGWVTVRVTVKYNLIMPFSNMSTLTVSSFAQRPIVR